jgi:ubiquinone/menaquinone biosynthesis C-methylase UbiE
MTARDYQRDFAHCHPAMYDIAGRERKALTMLAVLSDAMGERLSAARGLNIGCSTGIIDAFIASHLGHLTGIDIDSAAIAFATQQHATQNLDFGIGDAMALDFPDASMDVVLCSQVYEHVPDPVRMMDEIHRVLAPEGVCYFAATNKLCIVEQHYFLPFLSMLPQSLANRYLRLTGKGHHYYERHLTYWRLRQLASAFEVDDYTHRLVDEADHFGTAYMTGGGGIKSAVLRGWLRFALWAFPGYVWILRKSPAAAAVSAS